VVREAAKRMRVGQAVGSLVSSSCVAMATYDGGEVGGIEKGRCKN